MEPVIIFENDDVIVVDKPSGMIVLPDGKHEYPALTDWLAKKYEGQAHVGGFQLVHRIDRETSGVLIVAKNEPAYEFLKKQFQNREVAKTYRAFVYGNVTDERGSIDKPIGSARGGRGPRSALRPYGVTREAHTIFRRLQNTPEASYLEVMPKTGRTHQIRVHMAAIQRPIICDPLYAPTRAPLLGFERLALHALSLRIKLPPSNSGRMGGEERAFEAPLPPDFLAAEAKLRA